MANMYEVGDRVKVLIITTISENPEKKWEDLYAGTIITYHNFVDKDGNDNYLYKVSCDGVGDIVVAKEVYTEDGTSVGLTPADPDEIVGN